MKKLDKEYVVIGSGPAGVAAATALLARDVSVTMLDVGVELDEYRADILKQLQFQWNEKLYESLKHNIHQPSDIKLSYGSDYPYQKKSQHFNIVTDENIQCTPSFARGGLSNVWGAYTAPYNHDDMQGWPIKLAELAFYYEQTKTMLPVSENFQRSRQAMTLLRNMKLHTSSLESAGFSVHPATLSVYFKGKKSIGECFYCGNCQHGCPNNLIYSANDTLVDLLKNPKFVYIKNIVVEKIIEQDNKVVVFAHHLFDRHEITFVGARVFLAAGAIFSTGILLNSLGLFDYPVLLKQSQHFMFPCLMKKSTPQVETEKLHTMMQLSLRLRHSTIVDRPVHLQIYTYMDHYVEQFRFILKKLYPIARPILKPVINRMLVIQGYLHSDNSPACKMQLSRDAKTLSFHTENNAIDVPATAKALNRYLIKYHRQLGFFPVGFMTKFSKILRSNHYGGSFPMQTGNRSLTTTDLFGRPFGMEKLHVVDATIFPTIPAQSITMTVIANAYRIASECPL